MGVTQLIACCQVSSVLLSSHLAKTMPMVYSMLSGKMHVELKLIVVAFFN